MARGIQIQKQSTKLTRAQLTEISRANWQLINELKAINEEIAQELAATYQDSRELGRRLKGRLIATQEDLRRIIHKAQLPTLNVRTVSMGRKNRLGFKTEYSFIDKKVIAARMPTPFDSIIPDKGVATSIWNNIKNLSEGIDYWIGIVDFIRQRFGLNYIKRDWIDGYFRSSYDYEDDGNGLWDTQYSLGESILREWEDILQKVIFDYITDEETEALEPTEAFANILHNYGIKITPEAFMALIEGSKQNAELIQWIMDTARTAKDGHKYHSGRVAQKIKQWGFEY